ncbi:hypothetical protein K490DRAFT_65333 [Saccharata proteae CBS 121410]|uniref:Glycosyltransferase 2-like domain-containing protein n=1 Tax=Saccharata proteae CBS 121410 TaxID=1314787 RepID=A0A9P4LXC9_9PEZI|nr:hypothetical protein K490DRAFT_65333 [Saccharata proteae CBS 121410]
MTEVKIIDFDQDSFALPDIPPLRSGTASPVAVPAKFSNGPQLGTANARQSNTPSSILSSRSYGGDRHGIAVKYLHKKCLQHKWLEPPEDEYGMIEDSDFNHLGVLLRRPDGVYTAEPMFLNQNVVRAAEKLGVMVAFTMSSSIVGNVLQQLSPLQKALQLDPHGHFEMPIVQTLTDMASATSGVKKESYMCLCRSENIVLVWGDTVPGIIAHGSDIEARMFGTVWGSQIPDPMMSPLRNTAPASISQPDDLRASYFPTVAVMKAGSANASGFLNEKVQAVARAIEKEDQGEQLFDPERDGFEVPKRPFLITHAMIIGLAMVLVVVVEMACVAKLLTEVRLDGQGLRLALLVTVPLFATFSLFFMIVITGSVFQLFGPLSGVQGNSTFYSAKAPKLGRHPDYELPHVTIQMPVYKEGLKGVIIPTVESLVQAVKHYENLGGTASIYVNDDGMRLVKQDLAEARKAFYDLNHIGWCARPKECKNPDPEKGEFFFVRKGQFKKASNMNYCLDFSLRVEDEVLRLVEETCIARRCTQEELTVEEEDDLYEKARDNMLEKDEGRTLAGGNVRLGEIILIIDSDTRVPEDCLVYGALEMHESPEVALLQHASGILQVANNVFENGITYFTNLIYTSIQFAVGNGDCAPFVGHNTFIRWKAIQSISWFDEEDQMTKFWSDSHVSEDFDVSLRLQMNNFVVRLATYHNGGFKEGVSLTVYDELARWEKYAYGCNELVFNPLIRWPTHGPFTKLFRRFITSNIKITSKMTIFAYIGTYYAIASAIPLTLVNYLVVGWYNENVDQFYLTSWKIFVGMAVVFNVLSPLGYAMLRHRLGQTTFFKAVWETIKWTPMFLLFFGGISFHLAKAILCHFLSIKMEWTTTAKELSESGFRAGLDRIVRDFKYMYLFVVAVSAGMIYLAIYAPRGWQIKDFAAIVPVANQIGCHALLPFALGLF